MRNVGDAGQSGVESAIAGGRQSIRLRQGLAQRSNGGVAKDLLARDFGQAAKEQCNSTGSRIQRRRKRVAILAASAATGDPIASAAIPDRVAADARADAVGQLEVGVVAPA